MVRHVNRECTVVRSLPNCVVEKIRVFKLDDRQHLSLGERLFVVKRLLKEQ